MLKGSWNKYVVPDTVKVSHLSKPKFQFASTVIYMLVQTLLIEFTMH